MTEPAPPPRPGGQFPRDDDRSGPLLRVVAGVGIVAGVVFVVAVVFFSGFFLGWSGTGYEGRDWRSPWQPASGGMWGTCPMMRGAR